MGYYASGDGTLRFRREISKDELERVTEALFDAFNEVIISDDGQYTCLELIHYNEKYYGDGVMDALRIASECEKFVDGEAEFSGEDDCHWRFIYRDGEWQEENGRITYEDWDRIGPVIAGILRQYVETDLESADTDYVREVLFDQIGMREDIAKVVGLDYLMNGEEN